MFTALLRAAKHTYRETRPVPGVKEGMEMGALLDGREVAKSMFSHHGGT